MIDEVSCDSAKPGAQFFRLAQAAQLLPCGHESLLREILARGETARGAVSQRADQRLIARNNPTEGVAVAGKARAHQFLIVVRCDRHILGSHHIVTSVAEKRIEVTKILPEMFFANCTGSKQVEIDCWWCSG